MTGTLPEHWKGIEKQQDAVLAAFPRRRQETGREGSSDLGGHDSKKGGSHEKYMIIAVGSENPVKLAAARTTIAQTWPAAEVRGIAVPSGVSAMPMSDAECIAGARGRARAAVAALDAHLGLGLEGGVQPVDGQLFLTGWVVAVDRSGREGVGSAARLLLPPAVGSAVLAGRELGPLMDELTGRELTNHAEGAIGILTHQLMTRQLSFEAGLAYALVPWLSPELYP